MGLGDLGFVVDQHLEHFPDNVFGRLGSRFLTEYYRTFLDGPHAEAVIAHLDGEPVGYLVGILDVSEHRRLLRRFHARRLAWHAATALSRRPGMATGLARRRLAVTKTRRRDRRRNGVGTVSEGISVLSHVAVVAERRGAGIGTHLIMHFVNRAAVAGARTVALATRAGSAGSGPLYESLGWRLTSERDTFDGRRIALYDLDLTRDR